MMTVRELIRELRRLPGDCEVFAATGADLDVYLRVLGPSYEPAEGNAVVIFCEPDEHPADVPAVAGPGSS
jgi:hypothetical protein